MDRFQTEAAVLTVFLQPCAHLRSFIIIVFAKRENLHLFSRCRVHIRPDHAVTEKQRSDPWYTGDFDATYEDVLEGCVGFLAYLKEQGQI